MLEPTNEQGVIACFFMEIASSPWRIVSIGTSFPDAILEKDGEQWRVEFEFWARNFEAHGHDIRQCDLIICWQNNFPDCPIPILALSDEGWQNENPQKVNTYAAEVDYWKKRALTAERFISKHYDGYDYQYTGNDYNVTATSHQAQKMDRLSALLDSPMFVELRSRIEAGESISLNEVSRIRERHEGLTVGRLDARTLIYYAQNTRSNL